MSPHDLDAVIDFTNRYIQAEVDMWSTHLEPDIKRSVLTKARIAVREFLHPDIRDQRSMFAATPDRPRRPEPAWFDKAATIEVAPRTLFAVYAAIESDRDVALVWLNGFKKNDAAHLGRYAVVEHDGKLQITTYQSTCVECNMRIRQAEFIGRTRAGASRSTCFPR